MSISADALVHIAKLARLQVGNDELEATREQLNAILELVATMQAEDTTGIVPMAHAQDVAQRLREDVVTETNQREAFQAIAPQTENGLYLVPKVIE